MAILKVETDITANISASLIWQGGINVIISVEAFRTDVIFFYRWRHNVYYIRLIDKLAQAL
jgi:hypothetical protein